MPSARSASAPRFEGKEVTSFLTSIAQHGANASITDLDKLVSYILEYSTDDVKQLIRFMPEFDPEVSGKTWTAAKDQLMLLYGYAERVPDYTETMLKDFIEKSYASAPFTNMSDVTNYYRSFSQISVPLIKKAKIPTNERDFYFVAGLPKEVKDWFLTQVPDAQRKRSAPPSVPETIAILKKRFDEDSLAFQPWTEETKASAVPPLKSTTQLPAASNVHGTPQTPTNSVDDLARQLERLTLLLNAQSNNSTTPNNNPNQSNFQGQLPPAEERRCFMCGKVGTHRLGLRNCTDTQEMLDANIIRYDLNLSRYVLVDGSDLPRIPPGFPGGVADYLRALRANANANTTNANPAIARTSMMGLSYGESQVLTGNNFAVSSLDFFDRDTNPVTRSGKDTNKSVRFDPVPRPDNKGKARDVPPHMTQKPVQAPSAPTPSGPSSAPPATTPQPPTNPINRADGWKDSRPSNSKRNEDVVMRDAKKPTGDKYHITSELQERTDAKEDFAIWATQVNVPLLELIGLSPQLQKLFTDSTRSRREYATKTTEYVLNSEEDADGSLAQQDKYDTGSKHAFADASMDEIREFLVNYGSAVARVPEGRYYAMSTGSITLTIGNVELTAMIDTGSELNLAGRSVPDRCNLPVDFQGMNWSLKGIHGGPEQLRGCATDVSLRLGGHVFAHHLFVSHQEIGHHDIILGQPFLQWFAARIDYEREGAVSLYLWKNGSRKVNPTIVITITDPNDPRN
ncbi:hypothetical protein C8R45DRAFT_1161682, partial [Mycena sanguinolenta]